MAAPERLELQPVPNLDDPRPVFENFRRIQEWIGKLPRPTAAGSIAYWDGSRWIVLAPGAVGDRLTIGSDGLPQWAP